MAKGNMFLGMSRGSVGDVTFYRGRGQQLARARNRAPKNPRSSAQVIQRMILATASKAYSRMKEICDHSFQGIAYGADSQSFFLKRAMDDIRNWVSVTLPITGEYPAELRDPLLYRGLAYPTSAHQAGVGLLVSQGSLASIEPVLNTPGEGEDSTVDHFGQIVTGTTIQVVMNAVGAQLGDQITVIGLDDNGSFKVSRYVINNNATAVDLANTWDGSITSAAFDQVKSNISSGAILSLADGKLMPSSGSVLYPFIAGGVILSRKSGSTWERSTQRLVWLSDAGDYSLTDIVVAMWEGGTADVDVESPYYLNQAENF